MYAVFCNNFPYSPVIIAQNGARVRKNATKGLLGQCISLRYPEQVFFEIGTIIDPEVRNTWWICLDLGGFFSGAFGTM